MKRTGPFAFTKALMSYFTEQTGVEHIGDELGWLSEPRLISDVLVVPRKSFGFLAPDVLEKRDLSVLVQHLLIGF
ncbi:hypothetical protein N7462_010883 [Penicillium macrosclerotiorum]|uniref:uncharacterized protein n=1 Tax=Penicillium macrosclerotiorum TaxID=303699 RepID=UPI0025492934|nr:uncharacterized protein N7462_010883 [Penicillium macrosclerotiorum]KAJ5669813.1 hypothetical protein N7462_010883 [Penicillium macrosclerotiorum]